MTVLNIKEINLKDENEAKKLNDYLNGTIDYEKLSHKEIKELPSWFCFYCNDDCENKKRSDYGVFWIKQAIKQYGRSSGGYFNGKISEWKEGEIYLICKKKDCWESVERKLSIESQDSKIRVLEIKLVKELNI